jgi:hypothetical protein
MIELIATTLITISSVFLFCYWFRYTCLLMLSAKTALDYSCQVAYSNKLGFPVVQANLNDGNAPDLDRLRAALDNDYRVIRQLLKQMGEGQSALENRMLGINYRLMGTWYQVTRHFSPVVAARALGEMSLVVAHFANAMGEQAASAA